MIDNIAFVRERIGDSIKAKESLLTDYSLLNTVSVLANEIVFCIRNGGKLVICGNGGSASDALHFAGEIVGRFVMERQAWPAVVLNADVATMMCLPVRLKAISNRRTSLLVSVPAETARMYIGLY